LSYSLLSIFTSAGAAIDVSDIWYGLFRRSYQMSSHTIGPMLKDAAWHARMACVLSGALRLWDVAGTVQRDENGFIVAVDEAALRIVPRAPHGWLVIRGAETLGMHAGLPGLLRQLREELAPHARVGRLIIGQQSLL
jgi:hypothetical protein